MTLAAAKSSAIAAWTLDEASGTRVDQVGANDLTDNNTVLSATGKFGDAADFELANSEYLSIADNADLSMGDIDFMLRCWVNLESKTSFMGIAEKWDSAVATKEYLLAYNSSSDRFEFYVSNDGTAQTGVVANNFGSPSTATWYLLHAWHDATNNVIGISVNAGTADTAAHTTGVFNGTAPFWVGRHPVSNYYDGLTDDLVVLKNRFLDATERTEDYNGGAGVAFANWAGGGGLSIPIAAYHYFHHLGSMQS